MNQIEAKRRDSKITALRMLLRQLRQSDGSWSDGKRIWRGQDLDTLRRDVLHQIVQARMSIPTPQDAHHWKNLAAHLHLMARSAVRDGKKAPQLAEQLVAILQHRNSHFLPRVLRRHFPESYASLALEDRTSPKEYDHIIAAWSRKDHVLKARFHSDWLDLTFEPGTPVRLTRRGNFVLDTDQRSEEIDPLLVRRRRSRASRKPKPAPQGAEAPGF
ncbi:hypothetical protein [Defluviimonas salinarum]|uniref:Uncharacterized protein n=1 Tax=Defluviimonas salinarum TaxID=2992147 RepID=A0ABT3J9R6_9RHOB|nr:hypothetical protein [Defluviimonas salinarum]MCW3784437.1 hypothetical protein [Defluviimonas salinarum]